VRLYDQRRNAFGVLSFACDSRQVAGHDVFLFRYPRDDAPNRVDQGVGESFGQREGKA
jgi:hypothetical protein